MEKRKRLSPVIGCNKTRKYLIRRFCPWTVTRLKDLKSRKCLVWLLKILSIYFIIYLLFFRNYKLQEYALEQSQVRLEYVVLHLDFKGVPPMLSYLEKLLPTLKYQGVNALLMEYDTMFPYEVKRMNQIPRYSYDKIELQSFLEAAHSAGFEIIPYVQTFGHMEFVLQHKAVFAHLREIPESISSICPSRLKSKHLIKALLKQVIDYHMAIVPLKHVHIGCGEVHELNICPVCKARKMSDLELYVDHVKFVTEVVTDLSPNTTVLIWDDMLRNISRLQWSKIGKLPKIEPVYWNYEPDFLLQNTSLLEYRKSFSNIWIASAFKGADGRNSLLPDIETRADNLLSWMYSVVEYKDSEKDEFDFKGIILTGRSKYRYFDPPCDLLMASMPSLIISLIIIDQFKAGTQAYDHRIGFREFIDIYSTEEVRFGLSCPFDLNVLELEFDDCNFEGCNLYKVLKRLDSTMTDIITDLETKFDIDDVNDVNETMLNLPDLERFVKWCKRSFNIINDIQKSLLASASMYYERPVFESFVSQKWRQVNWSLKNCSHIKSKFNSIQQKIKKLKIRTVGD